MDKTICKCEHKDVRHRGNFNSVSSNNDLPGPVESSGSCLDCDCQNFEEKSKK